MKISYKYLQTLIHLPEPPEAVAKMLTAAGLEVESIEPYEKIPGGLAGVVIGRVLTCEKHPDADRLSLTTVDVGGEQPLAIVCGAPNVAAGQMVAVATVGTTLHPTNGQPFEIKKSKIRGAVSEGMICAEDELGLGTSHDGIMVLDTQLPPGTPASVYFNLDTDYVFEIGLTPNRADAASHLGVARDLKALLNRPVQLPQVASIEADSHDVGPITVHLHDAEACPRYCGLYMRGVKVAESPSWLQDFLKSIGLKPINNIVDITNLVLHELGQPMHAFDAKLLQGSQIHIRRAQAGEKITTLDKVERTLTPHDLVIADAKAPVALAGIMGGLHSSIEAHTTEIFLESAYFHAATIRKSSQEHSLKSDSSFRFERGTDPNMTLMALQRAVFLIKAIAGGQIVGAAIDLYPQPLVDKNIRVRYSHLYSLMGIELPNELIHQILNNLDIRTEVEHNYGHAGYEEAFIAYVPPYRVDVTQEADIAEEILRIYGFDNVPLSESLGSTYLSERPAKDANAIYYALSRQLAALGFNEIMTNSLTNPRYADLLGQEKRGENVMILNRLSEELEAMRQTLLFSMLETMAYNINRKQKSLKLFELGKIYWQQQAQYHEQYCLAIGLTGYEHELTWSHKASEVDVFQLKSLVQMLCNRLNIKTLRFKKVESEPFAYALELYDKQQSYGKLGMIKPALCLEWGIKQKVFFAELEWERLIRQQSDKLVYKEIPKFPEVRRDLSLIIDEHIQYEQIAELAKAVNKKLIREVQVFDIYVGEQIGAGKKSYSITFTLQDDEQTLTDQVIDKTMDRVIQVLEKELKAQVRR